MNKLLVICGPTATGKTNLGIFLAKKLNGEIISADSRQVYRGMDIGTGKDLPKSSKLKAQNSKLQLKTKSYKVGYHKITGIPVWLYDVVEPNQVFSAGEYAKLAWLVIEDIWKRGRLPILVGGTGFYIKAVVEGIETAGVAPDWRLREELRYYDIEILRYLLKKLNLERWNNMNESDRKNPRRLIRAIEVASCRNEKLKMPAKGWSASGGKKEKRQRKIKNVLFIGLIAPRKVLYERIDRRVEKRVKQGIIEEINRLLKRGYSWNDPGFNTLGYKQWQPFFEGKASKEDVVQKWKYAEHAYARRQLTWFKKEKRIKWYIGNS